MGEGIWGEALQRQPNKPRRRITATLDTPASLVQSPQLVLDPDGALRFTERQSHVNEMSWV